jgi:hypothetical protein
MIFLCTLFRGHFGFSQILIQGPSQIQIGSGSDGFPLPNGLLLPVSAPGGNGAVLGRHAGKHEGGHRLTVEVAQRHWNRQKKKNTLV